MVGRGLDHPGREFAGLPQAFHRGDWDREGFLEAQIGGVGWGGCEETTRG